MLYCGRTNVVRTNFNIVIKRLPLQSSERYRNLSRNPPEKKVGTFFWFLKQKKCFKTEENVEKLNLFFFLNFVGENFWVFCCQK
jgi:hypothetical protein